MLTIGTELSSKVSIRSWRIAAFALAVLSSALAAPDAASAGKPANPVIVHAGAGASVRTHPVSPWESLTPQTELRAGTWLKTGGEPISIMLTDSTRIQLDVNTVLQLQAPTEITLDPGATARVARLDIKEGSIRIDIPATARPLLVMASKEVFAAFRPGKGRARVTADGLVAAVDEGTARVAAAGRWTPLGSGQYQILRLRGTQEGPKPLPPKPSFVADVCHATERQACAIGLAVGDGLARVGVRWAPPAPGHRYIMELTRENGTGPAISRQELQGDQTSFVSAPLPVGGYRLNMQAVTPEGIEGSTMQRSLRVVRLLPELGVTWAPEQQVLVFPRGRKVRLDGTAGIQFSWLGADYMTPPPFLQLDARDESRVIRFRVQGDTTDDVVVGLERSALRADVEMTPTKAKWPKDPVRIAVRLQDPKRRLDVQKIHPRLRVRVNDTPYQVGLVRSGNLWQAEIPPKNGNGPWAVRVEVLGPDDNIIGRGLLNVIGRDSPSSGWW